MNLSINIKYDNEYKAYFIFVAGTISIRQSKKIESLYMNSFGLIPFDTKEEAERIKNKILQEVI